MKNGGNIVQAEDVLKRTFKTNRPQSIKYIL